MPFKSESQHRKFRILLEQGKISQETFDKWMQETKALHGSKHPIKPLSEEVKKASYFDSVATLSFLDETDKIVKKKFA